MLLSQDAADHSTRATGRRRQSTLLLFFLLVFGMSVPFWLLFEVFRLPLFPGIPVSALMTVCPMLAALLLVHRDHHQAVGASELLRRAFDHRRAPSILWYAPALFLMPVVMFLSYWVMRLSGAPLPDPQIPVMIAPLMFVVFFTAALGEELGWSGYAIDRMQGRIGALSASIVLGLMWAVWHIVPYLQAGRSWAWVAWQCLFMVAYRVVLVWIYNNAGKSVCAVALCHALGNVSVFLFPNLGSHYDPSTAAMIMAVVSILVSLVWGPRTLASTR